MHHPNAIPPCKLTSPQIQSLVRHSQLQQRDEANMNCYQSALETLDLTEKDTLRHLEEIQTTLAKHDAKGNEMKAEAAQLRRARARALSPDLIATQKGKGKEREIFNDDENEGEDEDDSSEHDDEDDPEEKDLPRTPAGEEHRTKRKAIKQRLREGQLVLHRVKFLQGDVYHVLGKFADEDAAYQAAETLRRELLKSPFISAYVTFHCCTNPSI
jgi:E3 ubiquitin-protein ligase SHPRH